LSTLAIEGSDAGARRGPAPLALRYADVVLLALAFPLFVAADLPLLGYAVCAAAWLAQHAVLAFADARAKRALAAGDRRLALGIVGGATLGRLWLVTAAILLVGLLGERDDGLAAAVLTFVLVTVHLGSLALAKLLYPEGSP
jgi:hypothetical protein